MIERKVRVNNKSGFHVWTASTLVKEAAKFSAKIEIIKGNQEANLKSIMGVLLLKAKTGDELLLRASGKDEKEALEYIVFLIESKLDSIEYPNKSSKDSSDYYNPSLSEMMTIVRKGVTKRVDKIIK